jgi:hypothetical protein
MLVIVGLGLGVRVGVGVKVEAGAVVNVEEGIGVKVEVEAIARRGPVPQEVRRNATAERTDARKVALVCIALFLGIPPVPPSVERAVAGEQRTHSRHVRREQPGGLGKSPSHCRAELARFVLEDPRSLHADLRLCRAASGFPASRHDEASGERESPPHWDGDANLPPQYLSSYRVKPSLAMRSTPQKRDTSPSGAFVYV